MNIGYDIESISLYIARSGWIGPPHQSSRNVSTVVHDMGIVDGAQSEFTKVSSGPQAQGP